MDTDAITAERLEGWRKRDRDALANCKACFDTLQVPIDGYLRKESRDPSERFRRKCQLCVVIEGENYRRDVRRIFHGEPKTFLQCVLSRLPSLFLVLLVVFFLWLMLTTK